MSVYVLGGHQTDFARNLAREGLQLVDAMSEAVHGALTAAQVDAADVEVGHVGNFTAELFAKQGQLGGLFASLDPAFAGLPSARHEAACASGSVALLAATAEIEAGRYDVACVVGVEQMRNVDGQTAAEHLGVAAWAGREAQEATFLWPAMFSEIADAYARRDALPYQALMALAELNLANARRNPNAQTRAWQLETADFGMDERNPVIEGRIRKQDCGRITDGAAAVILASERYAREHARRCGVELDELARVLGWGHRTAPMLLRDRLEAGADRRFVFPELRDAITDAWRRADMEGPQDIDGVELHDCFTITEWAILDHFDLPTPVAELARSGELAIDGRFPTNASGGLIGCGHPVGATGVRMLLDASKQVTGRAGSYQIPGARRVQTVNIGGSFTTCVSFVVGR